MSLILLYVLTLIHFIPGFVFPRPRVAFFYGGDVHSVRFCRRSRAMYTSERQNFRSRVRSPTSFTPMGISLKNSINSILVRKRTNFILKNEFFFKDPEDVKPHSTRPPTRYVYCVCSNKRACPWEHFKILVEAIDQLPTSLQQK